MCRWQGIRQAGWDDKELFKKREAVSLVRNQVMLQEEKSLLLWKDSG